MFRSSFFSSKCRLCLFKMAPWRFLLPPKQKIDHPTYLLLKLSVRTVVISFQNIAKNIYFRVKQMPHENLRYVHSQNSQNSKLIFQVLRPFLPSLSHVSQLFGVVNEKNHEKFEFHQKNWYKLTSHSMRIIYEKQVL